MKSLREQYEESQQNAFMREVGEAMRADRARALWNRWRYWIILAITIILSVTAFYNISRIRRHSASMHQAAKFERAMDMDGAERAAAMAAFVANAEYGYLDIGYQILYSLRLEAGDLPGAAEALISAVSRGTSPAHKNIAAIKLMPMPTLDEKTEAGNFRRLAGMKRSEPFYYTARLNLAADYAASSNIDAARRLLSEIDGDAGAPSGIKVLAAEISGFIASRTE